MPQFIVYKPASCRYVFLTIIIIYIYIVHWSNLLNMYYMCMYIYCLVVQMKYMYMHQYHEQIIQNRHPRSIRKAGGPFSIARNIFLLNTCICIEFLLKVPPPPTHPLLWDHAYLNNNHRPILDSQHVFSMPWYFILKAYRYF